ncbi:MAG: glycosyltransferase [Pseudomonadota bacterium]
MKRKKVLMILDNAPNYREQFLRQLAESCDLTVYAQPCEPDYLTPPENREGYKYVEYTASYLGGFRIQKGFKRLVQKSDWDVIFVNFNLRRPERLLYFFFCKSVRHRWVWRGRIVGRVDKLAVGRLVKKIFLRGARSLLVYNDEDARFCQQKYNPKTYSFNNTEVAKSDFVNTPFLKSDQLKLIYVGRFQDRKRLGRLLWLAARFPEIIIRVVGPDCHKLKNVSESHPFPSNIEVFDAAYGYDLQRHFRWCDAVVNPGHVGLLVMNAAKHGKPIFIDRFSDHAPEISLAIEAEQFFIDFENFCNAGEAMLRVWDNYELLEEAGERLQRVATNRYTIENMVDVHIQVLKEVTNES